MQLGILPGQLLIHIFQVKVLADIFGGAEHFCGDSVGGVDKAGFLEIIILYDDVDAERLEDEEEKEKIILPY
jgi:hypothetical protein